MSFVGEVTMNTSPKASASSSYGQYVLWHRPLKPGYRRAWEQIAIASSERAAWAEVRPNERGEWLVLPRGFEP